MKEQEQEKGTKLSKNRFLSGDTCSNIYNVAPKNDYIAASLIILYYFYL